MDLTFHSRFQKVVHVLDNFGITQSSAFDAWPDPRSGGMQKMKMMLLCRGYDDLVGEMQGVPHFLTLFLCQNFIVDTQFLSLIDLKLSWGVDLTHTSLHHFTDFVRTLSTAVFETCNCYVSTYVASGFIIFYPPDCHVVVHIRRTLIDSWLAKVLYLFELNTYYNN